MLCLVLAQPDLTPNKDEASLFACPRLLPALLELCARADTPQAVSMLERVCLCLRLCPENCDILAASPGLWQPQLAVLLGRSVAQEVGAAGGGEGRGGGGAGVGGGGGSDGGGAEQGSGGEGGRRSRDGDGSGGGGDVLAMLTELLCTFLVECLPRDPAWRALDQVLCLVHACGSSAVVRAARRRVLSRLLASLERQGKRMATELFACAPKLRRLCRAVRMHTLLPPAHSHPVSVNVAPRPWSAAAWGGGAAALRVELRLSVTPPPRAPPPWAAGRVWSDLLSSEGASVVSEEVELMGRLLSLLDPLLVKAMMDDETDQVLRARAESISGEARLMASITGTLSQGLVGATSLAGRVGAGLKVTLGGLVPRGHPHGIPTPPSGTAHSISGAALPSAADAAGAAIGAAVASAAALAGDPEIGSRRGGWGRAGEGGGMEVEEDPSSLHSGLLAHLLLLLQVPPGLELTPAGAAAVGGARQRVRELLWRDLEQGSAWAQLQATEGREGGRDTAGGGGEAVWAARRGHVLNVVASLALPLREVAAEAEAGRGQVPEGMAEALVPALQVGKEPEGVGGGGQGGFERHGLE